MRGVELTPEREWVVKEARKSGSWVVSSSRVEERRGRMSYVES